MPAPAAGSLPHPPSLMLPDHALLAPIDVGHATPPSDDERSAADAQVYTPVFTSAARAGGRERESEREGESESERERERVRQQSSGEREQKSCESVSVATGFVSERTIKAVLASARPLEAVYFSSV